MVEKANQEFEDLKEKLVRIPMIFHKYFFQITWSLFIKGFPGNPGLDGRDGVPGEPGLDGKYIKW